MVNIMLEGYDFAAPWLRAELGKYIQPGAKAVIAALSFRDRDVNCAAEWDALYAPGGRYYSGIVEPFLAYGIRGSDISFIDYFRDTHEEAAEKISAADIVFLPGGVPHRMMERITEMGLNDAIKSHGGVVMGFSAGAMIQLREYHVSPDGDYPEFSYYCGLGLTDGFYIEVHYEGAKEQDEAISRVLAERGGTVYATLYEKSALIIENGVIRTLGDVRVFCA